MLAKYLYEKIDDILSKDKLTFMEIGSFDGEGIAMLAKKYADRTFYSIDPFIEDGHTNHITMCNKGEEILKVREQFYNNISKVKNVIHFDTTTRCFIDTNKNYLPQIDILLIDGDHSFEGCMTDLSLAVLLSKNKELIVLMDDTTKESVRNAIKVFTTLFNIKIVQKEIGYIIFKIIL